MNYTEAVELAKAGDERGFGFLYQKTYKSKYYLALQYMKNEESAQDVMQEAYLRAFSKLDTLENPETFPSWLGKIVANTAKNMLAKKNPMLFSDVAKDDEGEEFEYQIEDDSLETQPENAYTRQETRELVHELLDSLSEEQRLCMLMFHIEGASIREIARALNCSENTVKSRLNYGRKNLKIKAEALQKKGYKLYSVAPVPMLLFLLRADAGYLAADKAFIQAGRAMADRIFSSLPSALAQAHSLSGGSATGDSTLAANGTASKGAASKAAAAKSAHAAAGAAKTGFLHTAAGKAAVIILGVCVAGAGAAIGITQFLNRSDSDTAVVGDEAENQPAQTQESEGPREMQEEEYPELIEGNLTKEELEFVFAYGPDEKTEAGIPEDEYDIILNTLCEGALYTEEYSGRESPIEDYGATENWQAQYSLADVNRLFLSFTTFQYSEDNDSDTEYGVNVEGDRIIFSGASLSYTASAEITSAEYTEEEMVISYTYKRTTFEPTDVGEDPTTTTERRAVLRPTGSGLYRIESITDVEQGPADEEGWGSSIQDIYEGVLQSIQDQEPGYDFPAAGGFAESYGYFVSDLDGDGIEELIVGAEFEDGTFIARDCRVFTCTKVGLGYELKQIVGDIPVLSLYIAGDGTGMYDLQFSRGTGQCYIYRLVIEDGTLLSEETDYDFIFGSSEMDEFAQANPQVEWKSIYDRDIFS